MESEVLIATWWIHQPELHGLRLYKGVSSEAWHRARESVSVLSVHHLFICSSFQTNGK